MKDTTAIGRVSVIGLGAMGSALARAFLAAEYSVTVWNRTAWKCAALAQSGAEIASSVEDALDSSRVAVGCVLDYAASVSLLHSPETSARLSQKTLVQLTTTLPKEAREEAAWAERHGIAYLDGAIQGYPQNMGTPKGVVLYAGPTAVFEATKLLLRCLGPNALFVGPDAGQASALASCLTASFTAGSVLAFLQGAAICEAEGISIDTYLSTVLTHMMPGMVADTLQTCVRMIKSGSYVGSQATLDTWASSLRGKVSYAREIGVDSHQLETTLGYLERALSAGHGQDELPAVFECFRKNATGAEGD